MVEPYRLAVSDKAIDDLKGKLALSTLPDELEDAGWDMGTPLSDMQRLVQYWKNDFDWRASESMLNSMPNYQTDIDIEGFGTLEIHLVHQRSPVARAIPLLFSHGWPGSFLEVKKLLPLLTEPDNDGGVAFHVVAPSLPNFGFSQGVQQRGFGLRQYAETCHKLMLKLGYTQYVTQGGDWGFQVTRTMGLLYPESCKASHINVTECFPPSCTKQPRLWLQDKLTLYSEHEQAGLSRTEEHQKEGIGYDMLQQTKPQTISYAFTDSPVALLGWIYEKLKAWTDNYPWTDDEILTWVCIYWFSRAGAAASTRIYYESTHADASRGGVPYQRPMQWIGHVKYGVASFPKDLSVHPNTWVKTLGNIVHHSRQPHGGHFAAVERPEAIVADLQAMFGRGGGAYGCVEGCDGY
ncbi:hypothetical protein LTR36_002284 [Oleoguttula mirabilis]|uniref:Epoxide hydrolase N-terminal domain-containing protein n=1 Tax=Oleoguttula mirabilis TaxID=1507867 RepID=A0AAV9JKX5_9PEZI|nr:hypothetical protein LTR36_002284 [Oleoguttula mirabilis]